jgi:hypothetical protein
MVYDLLGDTPIKIRFYHSGSFFVHVDLCYAVDSMIYLPLYLAEITNEFSNRGIKVSSFVSPDGDPGAVQAIVDGAAEFAICDPQAAIEYLLSSRGGNEAAADELESGADPTADMEPYSRKAKNDPVLVAILIDKLALWLVGRVKSELVGHTPRDLLQRVRSVVTYRKGSTANYVCSWQCSRMDPKDQFSLLTEDPGDEFRRLLSVQQGAHAVESAALTADVVGAEMFSRVYGGGETTPIRPYASTDFGKRFLFTGVLASRRVIEDYPGAVDAVIAAMLRVVRELPNEDFFSRLREQTVRRLERLYRKQLPWFVQECEHRGVNLEAAIRSSLETLRQLEIYSNDGRVHLRSLYRALRLRNAYPQTTEVPSLAETMRWLDTRCIGWRRKPLVAVVFVLSKVASWRLASLVGAALASLAATAVFAYLTVVGKSDPVRVMAATMVAIGAALAAPLIMMAIGSEIRSRRQKEI